MIINMIGGESSSTSTNGISVSNNAFLIYLELNNPVTVTGATLSTYNFPISYLPTLEYDGFEEAAFIDVQDDTIIYESNSGVNAGIIITEGDNEVFFELIDGVDYAYLRLEKNMSP